MEPSVSLAQQRLGKTMRRSRRSHYPQLKAMVAWAAVRGGKSLVELAEQFDLHVDPNQLTSGANRRRRIGPRPLTVGPAMPRPRTPSRSYMRRPGS